MEKNSIPGAAKIAFAVALSAATLAGCLYYGTGIEEGGGIPASTQAGAAPAPRNEAGHDTRALLGVLKGMGAGGGP